MLNKEMLMMNAAMPSMALTLTVIWLQTLLGVQQLRVYRNNDLLGEWGVHEAPIPDVEFHIGDTIKIQVVHDESFVVSVVRSSEYMTAQPSEGSVVSMHATKYAENHAVTLKIKGK